MGNVKAEFFTTFSRPKAVSNLGAMWFTGYSPAEATEFFPGDFAD
jgi:hypothetical protein